jgi:hypothetical protein
MMNSRLTEFLCSFVLCPLVPFVCLRDRQPGSADSANAAVMHDRMDRA